MEVRTRFTDLDDVDVINEKRNEMNNDDYDAKGKAVSQHYGVFTCLHESLNILKGRGSWWTFFLLPTLTLSFWLLLCFITHNSESEISLEERLAQQHIREILEPDLSSVLDASLRVERVEELLLLPEERVHIFMMMPYLNVNPLASTIFLSSLQWLTLMSSVPVVLHAVTNEESIEYVDLIMRKVNESANCPVDLEIFPIEKLIEETEKHICPKLTLSQDYCNVLMGIATPLLLPNLLTELDHAIVITPNITFQEDVGRLYVELQSRLREPNSELAILMSPEQTPVYMRAFAGWQRRHAATRWGRPPPQGRPGYNADLILMNLEKLRQSNFINRLSEHRVRRLVSQYAYHMSDEQYPSLGDLLNLLAIDDQDRVFGSLGCEWNRNSVDNRSGDALYKAFNVCNEETIKAWNNNNNNNNNLRRNQGKSVVKVRVKQAHQDL